MILTGRPGTHAAMGDFYSKQDSYEVRENFLKRRNVYLLKPEVAFHFATIYLLILCLFSLWFWG